MALGRRLTLLAIVLAALALPASSHADVNVPRGQSVDELRVFGDDVRVDGRLGNVLVVDGDVVVGPTGRLEGGVLIGGRLRTEGGEVTGEFAELGASWPHLSGRQIVLSLAVLLLFRSFAVWWLVRVGAVIARLALTGRLLGVARARPLRSLLVGALAGFGLAAGSLVLALSVLGLAVALALAGVLVACSAVGVAMVLAALGPVAETRTLVLGALLLPVVGDALLALASVVGLGALLRYAGDVEPAVHGVRSTS